MPLRDRLGDPVRSDSLRYCYMYRVESTNKALVTTNKALVTTSKALLPSSFLLLLVKPPVTSSDGLQPSSLVA